LFDTQEAMKSNPAKSRSTRIEEVMEFIAKDKYRSRVRSFNIIGSVVRSPNQLVKAGVKSFVILNSLLMVIHYPESTLFNMLLPSHKIKVRVYHLLKE
jgi:hypothetical protein